MGFKPLLFGDQRWEVEGRKIKQLPITKLSIINYRFSLLKSALVNRLQLVVLLILTAATQGSQANFDH